MTEYFLSQNENLSAFLSKLTGDKDSIFKVQQHDKNWIITKGENQMAADEKLLKEYTDTQVKLIESIANTVTGQAKDSLKTDIKANFLAGEELKKQLEATKIIVNKLNDEINSLKAMLGEDGAKLQKVMQIFKEFGTLVNKVQ